MNVYFPAYSGFGWRGQQPFQVAEALMVMRPDFLKASLAHSKLESLLSIPFEDAVKELRGKTSQKSKVKSQKVALLFINQ